MTDLKLSIRTEMLRRRSELIGTARKRAESNIGANFSGTIPMWAGDVIAGYNAMRGEPDIKLLLESLMEQGFKIALPKIIEKNDPLEFRLINKTTNPILNSRYGVMESPDECQKTKPNIIIVPLLAFDSKGYRVGYGGGFYDRTLAELVTDSDLISVGVAFSFQQIASVPHEQHDVRLDCVVTEKEVVFTADLDD